MANTKVMIQTTSSMASPLIAKIRYLFQLFRQYEARRMENYGIDRLEHNIEEYRSLSKRYLKSSLKGLKIMEIGYGARPFRACAMYAQGTETYGIDLERPLLSGGIRNLFEIAKNNGVERAIKSLMRRVLYDSEERKAFEKAFGCSFEDSLKSIRFVVGDASDPNAWSLIPNDLDLIYSEDVFEHIPEAKLEGVLQCIKSHLHRDGLILIRPNIWTGITGGHFVEWYPTNANKKEKKRRPPWGHLMTGFGEPTVYLNKMPLKAYSELFSRHCETIEMRDDEYGLGADFLTDDILANIPTQISRDELLTNKPLFVMKLR
jgi:hypothetical protein